MKPALHISIPTPCHENWNAMLPAEKGKFCQACQKQVVDFTHMSDTQVLHYFLNAGGNTCGRFSANQLQRTLVPQTPAPAKSRWLAVLIPLLALFNRAEAQQKVNAPKTATLHNGSDSNLVITTGYVNVAAHHYPVENFEQTVHISGYVTDSLNEPLANAAVSVERHAVIAVTDSTGHYQLSLKTTEELGLLAVHATGYLDVYKEIRFQKGGIDTIRLAYDPKSAVFSEMLGQVVTAGLTVVHVKPVTKKEKIKTVTSKLLDTTAFTLYPNPVTRGNALSVKLKAPGSYVITVLNNTGALLWSQAFADTKKLVPQIPVDAAWASGVYYVRVTDTRKNKQSAAKFIVP